MENRLLNDNELEQAQGGVDTSMLTVGGLLVALIIYIPSGNTSSEQGDFSSSTYSK